MASALLKFYGTLLSGAEQFQHSLVVDDAVVAGDEEVWSQWAADAIADAFAAVPSANPFPSTTAYTGVSAAEILNLSTGALSAAHHRTVSHAGGGSGNLPPQCSVAVSLTGGQRANGTPIRGRFYLPGPRNETNFFASNGRLSTGGQEAYWIFADALVWSLNRELQDAAPQVWSRALGNTTTVTEVRVGKAVDTIRSRRADIPEEYLTGV